jgi:predicted phage terminase large subunit-like protein
MRTQFQQHIMDGDGQPEFIGIEDSGSGIGVYQLATSIGLPTRPMRPMGKDKLVRANDAMNRMERGKIWLPEQATWLEKCESEVFTWTGHPMELDDQIDTLAYAALEVSREAGSDAPMTGDSMPMAMSTAGGLPW